VSADLRVDADRAALVVVDVQEAFRPSITNFDQVAHASGVLIQAAREVGLPIVVTEQYPKGLGRTVDEVATHLPDEVQPVDKVCFSAAAVDGFDLAGREQAIVCGVEAHVCVSHTALDLLAAGTEVHVVCDGVGSRAEANRELGLRKLERAGAVLTSVETVVFELVREAGTPEFKVLQGLVK
jgi:nicotinamidase-related amidase